MGFFKPEAVDFDRARNNLTLLEGMVREHTFNALDKVFGTLRESLDRAEASARVESAGTDNVSVEQMYDHLLTNMALSDTQRDAMSNPKVKTIMVKLFPELVRRAYAAVVGNDTVSDDTWKDIVDRITKTYGE